jgi:hypothetical protein
MRGIRSYTSPSARRQRFHFVLVLETALGANFWRKEVPPRVGILSPRVGYRPVLPSAQLSIEVNQLSFSPF